LIRDIKTHSFVIIDITFNENILFCIDLTFIEIGFKRYFDTLGRKRRTVFGDVGLCVEIVIELADIKRDVTVVVAVLNIQLVAFFD
jgi:hypothetical protein